MTFKHTVGACFCSRSIYSAFFAFTFITKLQLRLGKFPLLTDTGLERKFGKGLVYGQRRRLTTAHGYCSVK